MRGETHPAPPHRQQREISIHSPHARGDLSPRKPSQRHLPFQSTPLMRGETGWVAMRGRRCKDFNPLPSCEGRPAGVYGKVKAAIDFNPLPSCEGRRKKRRRLLHQRNFNPLPSCEGRPLNVPRQIFADTFQSTPLMRGETTSVFGFYGYTYISIHSPHARGDISAQSTSPKSSISIHSPHARGDGRRLPRGYQEPFISIHSPHARGDSISRQKSIRIYVSLHNKNMIHRFLELYKPLFSAQNPIFRVRSPRKSHDSFTFARPSEGRGITP